MQGNYEQLKAAIAAVIKTNGNNEITGALMQQVLQSIVSQIGQNGTFAGIATPATNPGTPDQNVFYLASESGVYPNFAGYTLEAGHIAVFANDSGAWTASSIEVGSSVIGGFVALDSIADLPESPSDPHIGYIVGTHLYVYVGTGGDTLDGKYKDCGEFKGSKGEAGVSIASVTTPTPANGTAIITLSNGDTITLDLMHSHENMAKLVVVDDESELPSTMDESTIYAVKGTTEITKLFVGSLPFSPSPAPTPTYEDLTAVKLTGTQWLLTDYYPNANTEFEMVIKFTANENTQSASLQGWCFLKCDNPTSDNKFVLYNGLAGSSGTAIYGAYQIFIALDSRTASIDMKTKRVEFEADQATLNYVIGTTNGTLTFNGGSIRSTTLVKKASTQLTPIQIGNDASKGDNGIYKSFDLTIYRFTITENGNTVRNWLPKSLNGEAGLYDTINDTFITSQTDTPLVAIP